MERMSSKTGVLLSVFSNLNLVVVMLGRGGDKMETKGWEPFAVPKNGTSPDSTFHGRNTCLEQSGKSVQLSILHSVFILKRIGSSYYCSRTSRI
jgi:hypothetical protein